MFNAKLTHLRTSPSPISGDRHLLRSMADAKTARDCHAPAGGIFALQHGMSKGDLRPVS